MRIIARNNTDWGAEIRRFRRLRAIKQTALADILGVDQATVSRWEGGRQIPDLGVQRRLRALMQGTGSQDDSLHRHWVDGSVGDTMLLDATRTILAASPEACRRHGAGARATALVGRSAAPLFTEELETLWWQIVERGFFEGEIASAAVVSRANTLADPAAAVAVRQVWTPVAVSSGEVLQRVDSATLSETEYGPARARNGGALRVVTMDDLASVPE